MQATLDSDNRDIKMMRTQIIELQSCNSGEHAELKRLRAQIADMKVLQKEEETEIAKLKARNNYDEHKMKQLRVCLYKI